LARKCQRRYDDAQDIREEVNGEREKEGNTAEENKQKTLEINQEGNQNRR
jgi:hypothetical protein